MNTDYTNILSPCNLCCYGDSSSLLEVGWWIIIAQHTCSRGIVRAPHGLWLQWRYPRVPLISAVLYFLCGLRSRAAADVSGVGGSIKKWFACVSVYGRPLRPDMALRGSARALSSTLTSLVHLNPSRLHTHIYRGKPALISCYYAPLKQLSVQRQMRGWHRRENISRGLKQPRWAGLNQGYIYKSIHYYIHKCQWIEYYIDLPLYPCIATQWKVLLFNYLGVC